MDFVVRFNRPSYDLICNTFISYNLVICDHQNMIREPLEPQSTISLVHHVVVWTVSFNSMVILSVQFIRHFLWYDHVLSLFRHVLTFNDWFWHSWTLRIQYPIIRLIVFIQCLVLSFDCEIINDSAAISSARIAYNLLFKLVNGTIKEPNHHHNTTVMQSQQSIERCHSCEYCLAVQYSLISIKKHFRAADQTNNTPTKLIHLISL